MVHITSFSKKQSFNFTRGLLIHRVHLISSRPPRKIHIDVTSDNVLHATRLLNVQLEQHKVQIRKHNNFFFSLTQSDSRTTVMLPQNLVPLPLGQALSIFIPRIFSPALVTVIFFRSLSLSLKTTHKPPQSLRPLSLSTYSYTKSLSHTHIYIYKDSRLNTFKHQFNSVWC